MEAAAVQLDLLVQDQQQQELVETVTPLQYQVLQLCILVVVAELQMELAVLAVADQVMAKLVVVVILLFMELHHLAVAAEGLVVLYQAPVLL